MPNFRDSLDGVFRALSDPTRRAVIGRLSEGPASVSTLAEPFDMALPSFVQHLRVLEECGLVESEKAGRIRTCRLRGESLAGAEAWLADRRRLLERRLDALEEHLSRNPVAPRRRRKEKKQ